MNVGRGALKHQHIKQPKIKDLRVTPYTVRSEILRILGGKIIKAKVLDLFAGSGSLGLDALNSGANETIFVDINEGSGRKIRESLKALNLMGRGHIYLESCEKYIKRNPNANFDIIFFTPPYKDLHLFLLPHLQGLLKEDGQIIIEYPPSSNISQIGEVTKIFRVENTINFGWSRVSFLSLKRLTEAERSTILS